MTNERAIENIRAIKHYLTIGNPMWNVDAIEEACGMAIKALEELERKTGHWFNITNDESLDTEWECSECGWELFLGYNPTNYCPHCGALMEGESE